MLFNKADEMQNISILRSKTNRKAIVRTQTFSQNMTHFSFLIQNLTRCRFLVSKSDSLQKVQLKKLHFEKSKKLQTMPSLWRKIVQKVNIWSKTFPQI